MAFLDSLKQFKLSTTREAIKGYMNSSLKYFIYARKSSEGKDRQALSIESQIRELREFAAKFSLEIIDVFEESQSAYKLGRPVFDGMMKQIEAEKANALLVWKPDRLARNALDGGRVIQAIDDNHLKEIRTPYECYKQEDNRMMLYILFGMSNDYSRQISANVKRGLRQKYARGEYPNKAPIGYINAKTGLSRNIVPDPEKADLIVKVYKLFATGNYSVMDMLKVAKEWGLTSIYGKDICKSAMYRILTSTDYYGVYRHGGEYHQGSYEPIISKTLYDQVQ